MLFLLTGDVQTGKTRWLAALADELASGGVDVAGVLAPGVWRERGRAGERRFEKLGIDNVLLPTGERIAFARRRDLALAEGSFDPTSQSAAAQLAWEISDDAIARVNAHFDALAHGAAAPVDHVRPAVSAAPADHACPESSTALSSPALPVVPACSAAPARLSSPACPVLPNEVFHVKHSFAQTNVSRETSGAVEACETRSGLLVVDELGRLELMHDGGLVSATALLAQGPRTGFRHAIAVVRGWLLPRAEERFAAAWGGAQAIAPDDASRALVRAACGLADQSH
ncbi:hypothetical protein [Eggerthella timonensis]|uniref:hypothetical protein n=1 Tax=Eggerthella timonensis TaxID=1871008 RepID=UPI000C7904CB|nr:hypothetical protein [Eggerthella timonensis]